MCTATAWSSCISTLNLFWPSPPCSESLTVHCDKIVVAQTSHCENMYLADTAGALHFAAVRCSHCLSALNVSPPSTHLLAVTDGGLSHQVLQQLKDDASLDVNAIAHVQNLV